MKKSKEDLSKWRGVSCLYIDRFNILKILIFLNSSIQNNENLNLWGLFIRNGQKWYGNSKSPEELTQICKRARITVKIESSRQHDTCISIVYLYVQINCNKSNQEIPWKKIVLSTNDWTYLSIHGGGKEHSPYLIICTNINFKYITSLKKKNKTVNILKKISLWPSVKQNFLDMKLKS